MTTGWESRVCSNYRSALVHESQSLHGGESGMGAGIARGFSSMGAFAPIAIVPVFPTPMPMTRRHVYILNRIPP